MTKTYFSSAKHEPKIWLIDATGKVVGRLAARIIRVLLGKENPAYTPHQDRGDRIIVINAKDMIIPAKKLEQKFFSKHTNYPSGLKTRSARQVFEKDPTEILHKAIYGMIPNTALGKKLFRKLRIFPGSEHPHEAQKPQPLSGEAAFYQ